jgi:tRNA A-37 threonylcarbamoyl transferase component Bud32
MSSFLLAAAAPFTEVRWAFGAFACVLFVFSLLAIVLALVIHGQRRRRLQMNANLPAPGKPRQSLQPIAPEPVAEPRPSHCPVCGIELPADTPQGLCPQCLMQCVLSSSDRLPPAEEGSDTTAHPQLPGVPTPAELAPLFPELEILELLGQGGMGAVYKARQRKLDRLVAIKILPPEWGRDPAFAERFAREARALARLNHPQVVSVHDFGEAGGHFFLIMEFVDGANLRQLLSTGRLQPRQALPIVNQVCEALQYAHEQGIVHRDIKPENILLDKRGRVKIADFGLAKLVHRSRSEFTLTGSRQIMGTVHYMAPEQQTNPQAVDHRADIYSLGVVFYEMLTGELPLGRFAPPSERAGVDSRLDEVVFRALQTQPDQRYQRISAVKADVESILRAEAWLPASAPAEAEPDLALVQMQTRGPAAGLAVVAMVMFLEALGLGIYLLSMMHEWARDDSPPALFFLLGVGVAVVLGLIGTVLVGAFHLARCKGYEWVMIATILVMLPLPGASFLLGLPIGIWTLVVLRREEVKAAFAHNLRRAQRVAEKRKAGFAALQAYALELRRQQMQDEQRPPGAASVPTTPGGHPVRSFFLSVFSMFASRSKLGPLAQSSPEGEKPKPASKGKRAKRDMTVFAKVMFAVVVGAAIIFAFVMFGIIHIPSNEAPGEAPWEAVLLGDLDDLASTMHLTGQQSSKVRQVLLSADREYLELELRHTSREKNKTRPEGGLLVAIGPFSEEVTALENRLWSRLDSIVPAIQYDPTLSKQLPARGAMFPFGKDTTTIEIWRDNGWFHWKVTHFADEVDGPGEQGNGMQLPRRYLRFWQGGPPKASSGVPAPGGVPTKANAARKVDDRD